ncbi:MAG: SGNH/GDSL hydrolase family protein [Gemmatimonadota bacterium]
MLTERLSRMVPHRPLRGHAIRGARWLTWLAVILLVTAGSIAVALAVTPLQTVGVAGQDLRVGATMPDLSLSGPGEIDLFGQSLPTTQQFTGPVRPKVQLSQITINSELTTFVQGSKPAGATRLLGSRLAAGWLHYFTWETVIAGACALVGVGALAGWRRLPPRTTIKLVVAGLVVTEAINVGAIMITTYRAPAVLQQVHSLNELVGNTPVNARARPAGPALPGVQAVVLGDSTAAGAGLAQVSRGTWSDAACGRSPDSYASDLAAANDWHVLNASCDSATISEGLLGSQFRSGRHLPPQIDVAQRAPHATVVIVSVGADDLNWSTMVVYCAVAPRCDDRATTAYFQQQLAQFSKDYLQLLSQLATLPGHPTVIVNRYYDPFGPTAACLTKAGLTDVKLRTLNSRLATLNAVLAKGAQQFGFASPQPDFAGHQLCSAQPYVQGLTAPAPFHPTALGQLAIALTDQAVLRTATGPSSAGGVRAQGG